MKLVLRCKEMYDTCEGVVIPGVPGFRSGKPIFGGSLQVEANCEPLGRPCPAAFCSKGHELDRCLE
jgi:hypothetical protein